MNNNAEEYLVRWQDAGLLDANAIAAIRAYEVEHTKPRAHQWQVLLALIFGGILLGAGVLLFVAAHWDVVSPGIRLLMVLATLVFFHSCGWLAHEKFAGLATAMHAVGTVAAGNVTGTNELSPYGEVLSSNTSDSFSYAGLTQDTEYGGDAATFRNYTTEQLRWTRPDPYDGSYDMSNPQSFNRYVYAMNNPLNNIDPTGLQDENGNPFPFDNPFLPADATWGTSYAVDSFQVSNSLANSLMFSGTLQSRMTWSYTYSLPGVQPYQLVNEVYEIDYDLDLMWMQSAWNIGTGAGAATATNNSPKNGSFPWGWPFNGNMLPLKPGTQDNKCTTGPLEGSMDRNPAVLSCCQAHDNCYAANQCNATSWIPNPLPWGACNVCNAKAAACITGAVLGH